MIQKMKSVLVVGPKADFSQIVDLLYHMGTIHLEEVTGYLKPGSENIRKIVTGSMTDIPASAWKGRFLLSRAMDDLSDALMYFGDTVTDEPVSTAEIQDMRRIRKELEAHMTKMRSWGGEQIPDKGEHQ